MLIGTFASMTLPEPKYAPSGPISEKHLSRRVELKAVLELYPPPHGERFRGFLAQIQPGDELWSFSTGFRGKGGCLGYAVVRNGKAIDHYITLIS